jgi:cation-transporting P-type ATPase 13A2
VAKTSIKAALNESNGSSIYDPMKHKKHTIAAGTTILECKANECLAVVVSTGSYTSKGKLLREVFSYERHRFKFDEQVPIVIAILLVESLVAFIFIWLIRSDTPVFAWFYGMYVLSTLLPPLLPTVFTVSVGVSDNRLTKKRISCSQSDDILVAGKVSKAFFDKTGTLAADVACFLLRRSRVYSFFYS